MDDSLPTAGKMERCPDCKWRFRPGEELHNPKCVRKVGRPAGGTRDLLLEVEAALSGCLVALTLGPNVDAKEAPVREVYSQGQHLTREQAMLPSHGKYDVRITGFRTLKMKPGFVLEWSANVGFGELTVWQLENGSFEVDTEAMSDGFVDEVFAAFRRTLVRKS